MRAFQYLRGYKITVAVALFFMLVELGVELTQPLLIAHIINTGIVKKDLGAIGHWGLIMLGVSLIAFVAGVLSSFFAAHTSQGFGFDLRVAVFEKIQTFSFSNFNQFPTSSLITRMTNDITQVQNTVFMGLRIMLRAPLLVIGGTIAALLVSFRLSIFLALVIPFLVVFLIWAMNLGRRLFRMVQERLDRVNGRMRENLTSMRLIKAMRRGSYETGRFSESADDLKQKTVNALRLMETTMPTLLLVMNLCLIGIIWLGNIQLHNGSGTQVGDVVAIVNYTTRITAAFTPLSFIIMGVSRARASSTRLSLVLTEEVDLTDKGSSQHPDRTLSGQLEFQEVHFRYPGTESEVLKDLSFFIKPGQTVAVMGATGSGKTSLFQLIPRLYDVTKGAILVDGEDIREFTFDQLRTQIGYVPQEALLFTGSVRENITWGKPHATDEEVVAAAKHAQIHETILSLPHQYESLLGQKGVNLSGGQKQRLSIARALVRQPKILLLDDSTSALDMKTEQKLLGAIAKNYACTMLLITQKVTTAQKADLILLLDEGQIIGRGTHKDLLSSNALYQAIYHSQFGKDESIV